jgi:hypothetical protein
MGILTWFLDFNCWRQWWWILVCSTVCLFVLHPVLEALVPCRYHFESHCWDLLSHVTHLFLSLSFVVYSQDLLSHCSLLPELWISCWLYCWCFLFLRVVWTSFGTQAPNVCQCCLHVYTSVCRIVLCHFSLVPDCLRSLYTCTEFEIIFIFLFNITMYICIVVLKANKNTKQIHYAFTFSLFPLDWVPW